jgi:hypothetical protein
MADVDDIKAIAKQVWPDADHIADHIDVDLARSGHTSDPDASFRLSAIHSDGSIMGQAIAADLEALDAKVRALLRGDVLT